MMLTQEEIMKLPIGARVRATCTIYDLPGNPDPGPIRAEIGDEGTVVHCQDGLFPTVTFDRTGGSTCVTHNEVEVVP